MNPSKITSSYQKHGFCILWAWQILLKLAIASSEKKKIKKRPCSFMFENHRSSYFPQKENHRSIFQTTLDITRQVISRKDLHVPSLINQPQSPTEFAYKNKQSQTNLISWHLKPLLKISHPIKITFKLCLANQFKAWN